MGREHGALPGVRLRDRRRALDRQGLLQRRQPAQSRGLRVRRRPCRPGVVHRCRGRRHRPLGRVQFRHVGVHRALLLPHPEPAGGRRARREPRDRRGDRRRQRGAGRARRLRGALDHARNGDRGPRDLHARVARRARGDLHERQERRRLGLDRIRAVPDRSHQLLGPPHRGGWRSRDVSPVALRLARAGRRGKPQGGAAWRHPGEGDDFPRLCSRGLDRRPFGLPLRDARERRRLRHRRRAWSSSP